MSIKIKPLTKDKINEAIALIERIFDSSPTDIDSPRIWFPASLYPEKYKKYYEKLGVIECRYFLAIDSETDKIIGTTGYYELKGDKNEADWLGWFSVSPEYRRKGIGTKLLEFIKNKSKIRGKKYLRLYTTDSPEEKPAQKFYDSVRLEIKKQEPTTEYKRAQLKIYRELKL
jgi:GNAT superfamily N-acetyltransferase